MKIYNSIDEIIGNTPLIRLNKLSEGLYSKILVKLESSNPAGSVKDRLAIAMINDAEKKGLINENTEIIEPTSGNTGVGLAMICAVRNYKLTIVMAESMSMERRNLLKAYGVNLVLTPADKGMIGAIEKAKELAVENPNSFIPNQFSNNSNAEIHKNTTANEIWEQTGGEIDFFVAGVGTGGTFTGVSAKLKELNSNIKCVAVEPKTSAVLSGNKLGTHKIQGIGAGFIPDVVDTSLIDSIITVTDEQAFENSRKLVRSEGILSGISAGANVFAAIEIAKQKENAGKTIVTIIPDTGERYLSTSLFNTNL